MPKNNMPSVGIGLPVYNNAKFISRTLDSILNQTYPNITLYLSDDCSNDGTDEICNHYAGCNSIIEYSRNKRNVGPIDNHRKVLSLADTDYFMFSRGHEILSPNLVEECVQILEHNSEAVLAFATPKWVDENDQIMHEKHLGYFDTRGFDVFQRSIMVFLGNLECFYGLARTQTLRDVRVFEEIIVSDLIMLLEMALMGSFAHSRSSVRFRRYLYGSESYSKRIVRYQQSVYRKLKPIDQISPYARIPYHLFLSVKKSGLSLLDKIKVFGAIIIIAPLTYFIKKEKKL